MKKEFLLKQDSKNFHFLLNGKRISNSEEQTTESLDTLFDYHYDNQTRRRERGVYVNMIGNRSVVGVYCFMAPPKDAITFASADQENLFPLINEGY